MVDQSSPPTPPEQALALSYAPRRARAGVEALFALDRTLGAILRTTREPVVGQMRLTWWFEALERLDREPPPAQPELAALAASVVGLGVPGAELAALVDGWEPLLPGGPLDEAALELVARGRGARLFTMAARLIGADDAGVEAAGEGWALADVAGNLSDPAAAALAARLAAPRLERALARRWSRAGRALGALAASARADLRDGRGSAGSPARVARLILMRVAGR